MKTTKNQQIKGTTENDNKRLKKSRDRKKPFEFALGWRLEWALFVLALLRTVKNANHSPGYAITKVIKDNYIAENKWDFRYGISVEETKFH